MTGNKKWVTKKFATHFCVSIVLFGDDILFQSHFVEGDGTICRICKISIAIGIKIHIEKFFSDSRHPGSKGSPLQVVIKILYESTVCIGEGHYCQAVNRIDSKAERLLDTTGRTDCYGDTLTVGFERTCTLIYREYLHRTISCAYCCKNIKGIVKAGLDLQVAVQSVRSIFGDEIVYNIGDSTICSNLLNIIAIIIKLGYNICLSCTFGIICAKEHTSGAVYCRDDASDGSR